MKGNKYQDDHKRHLTRQGKKRPKHSKSWWGRVNILTILRIHDRLNESTMALEVREELAAKKRNRERGRRTFKRVRENRDYLQNLYEERRDRALKLRLKRDANGRFLPKRKKTAVTPP